MPKIFEENEKMELEIDDIEFAKKHKNDAISRMMWTEKYKPTHLD